MKHLSIHVIGKVQGVWFRVNTKETASKLGLFGFVKNEADGSVYIEVSGDENNIENFVAWCKKGEAPSRVDELIIKENDKKYHEEFIIMR